TDIRADRSALRRAPVTRRIPPRACILAAVADADPQPSTGGGALDEAELRHLVDLAPLVLGVMEPDGRVSSANAVAVAYFGISLSALATMEPRSRLVHPDDIAQLEKIRQKAVAAALPFEAEQRMLGKDGTYRWVLVRYVPLMDREGRLVRWYGGAI